MRIYAVLLALVLPGLAASDTQTARTDPLDPQRVQDQDAMTWADYRQIPGANWADNSVPGERVLRVALVAVDFPDQPFVITMPKRSDLFGNPQVDPIAREQVPQFYADFWGKPNALNHGHTIHEFWMEQSRGKVGIPKIRPILPPHADCRTRSPWPRRTPAASTCHAGIRSVKRR